jgi:hypothetical protein
MTFLQKKEPFTGKIELDGLCLAKCVLPGSHKNEGLTE